MITTDFCRSENVEEVRKDLRAKVEILDMTKRYQKKAPKSVDGLNLKMYEDEITCLLGHNGAGKCCIFPQLWL